MEREIRFYTHDYKINEMIKVFEDELGAEHIKSVALYYPFEIEPGTYIVGVNISEPTEGEIDQFDELREKLTEVMKSSPLV